MSDAANVAQVADGLSMVKFIGAFVFVIGAMFLLSWALKRAGIAGHIMRTGQKRRLQLVESMPVDARRRVVLIKRDDREHLVLLGPDHAAVIETDIPSLPPSLVAVSASEEDTPRATA